MRKIFVVLALSAVSAGVMAAPAAASHSWGTYHWARNANPFPLQVGDNVSGDWDAHLVTAVAAPDPAIADWDASSVLNLTVVLGSTDGRKCRATLGRIEVCNAAYGKNGWLGLASISLSGGHITQGTAKMNDSYFNMSTYNNPNEKLHVMCQEIGHDFGLGHTSEDGSSQDTCMDYFSNTGTPNATSTLSTHPNAHDYEQLNTIYGGHLEAGTTATSSTATGPSMADREGTRPYRSERRDSKRFSILTERFSDGSIRVTHYTWAT